jgi:hypothetical protein
MRRNLWFLGAAFSLLAMPAVAQLGGGGMSGGMPGGMGGMGGGPGMRGGSPRGGGEPRAVPPPPPRLQADPWPRLDAGAVFCRTLEDLRSRVALLADPASAGRMTPGCRTVTRVVPARIINRMGPGATQVEINAPNSETGWTDAWMPERAGSAPQGPGAPGAPPRGAAGAGRPPAPPR